MTKILGILTFVVATFSHAKERPKAWFVYAESLSGVNEAEYRQLLGKLRATKGLEDMLRAQIESDDATPEKNTYLAFDVIATLQMKNMRATLQDYSARDESGYSYHALNALIDKENQVEIQRLYRERILSGKTSLAASLALLDTLARLGVTLPVEHLEKLLRQPHPDLRSAVLLYARSFLMRRQVPEYRSLLDKAEQLGPGIVREQVRSLRGELL